MARGRRKTKYTWLPPVGTAGPGGDVEDTTNGRDLGSLLVPANGTTSIVIVDLLQDEPPEETQVVGLPMGVALTSEYFIKRIVGKFFISADQDATATLKSTLLVGAGIFIARAEDTDSAAGNFVPIGALTQTQAVDNYSPLRAEVIREPWIWRRTWVLQNELTTQTPLRGFPRTTTGYGSVADGPHIDAKTARRVGNDDRLWAVVAVRNFPLNSTADAGAVIRAYIDYRVLGAARRARGRSAF